MSPSYLLVLFEEDKAPVPNNSMLQFIEKKTWQTLQNEMIQEIKVYDDKYQILRRRSFQVYDWTKNTMVLVLDIKKM